MDNYMQVILVITSNYKLSNSKPNRILTLNI